MIDVFKAICSAFDVGPIIAVSGASNFDDWQFMAACCDRLKAKHGKMAIAVARSRQGICPEVYRWGRQAGAGMLMVRGLDYRDQNESMAAMPGVLGGLILGCDDATRDFHAALTRQSVPVWVPKR